VDVRVQRHWIGGPIYFLVVEANFDGRLGIAERSIVTTMVIWTAKLVVGFIASWMALKVAGCWGLLKDPTTRNRSTNGIALLVS
jgi:hypothetical protein